MEKKSLDDLVTIVLGAIEDYHVKAGEVFPITGVQIKLYPAINAEEYARALEKMQEDGLIEPSRPGFARLTAKGFERM